MAQIITYTTHNNESIFGLSLFAFSHTKKNVVMRADSLSDSLAKPQNHTRAREKCVDFVFQLFSLGVSVSCVRTQLGWGFTVVAGCRRRMGDICGALRTTTMAACVRTYVRHAIYLVGYWRHVSECLLAQCSRPIIIDSANSYIADIHLQRNMDSSEPELGHLCSWAGRFLNK